VVSAEPSSPDCTTKAMSPAARARRNSGSRKRFRRFNTVIMADKMGNGGNQEFRSLTGSYNKGLNELVWGL
jgi:hypothetical protein